MKTKTYRAAGGVVIDAHGRVLLIERDVTRNNAPVHEVRLPKGHVEEGESDLDAAIRETCEESGYCDLSFFADLGEARSEYDHKGKHYIRDEHYYLLRLRSTTHRDPDVDPDSEEALFHSTWAESLSAAQSRLSYPTEIEFARRAQAWLQQSHQSAQ